MLKYENNSLSFIVLILQIYPEVQVNKMHAVYDKHHKVSSFLKMSPKHT